MKKLRSDAFFKAGVKNLKQANEELFKSEVDIVSYSVCKNSQFAMDNFLRGFLLSKGQNLEENETIDTLHKKCQNIDPDFIKIDIGAIACRDHKIDSRYCTKLKTVNACFEAADSVDTLLRKSKLF
ncbi:MAG: hypothetical protein COB60_09300 [Flavobacteriaceae bacterium]|nr:MAG: hypothetical protein COB60_09300 [Flavobacteriaceae bacterium]